MLYETTTLALLTLRGIGPKSVASFWSHAPTPSGPGDLHHLLSEGALPRLKDLPTLQEVEDAWKHALHVLERCEREAITVLGKTTPLPECLLSIPNPPLILFVAGNHSILQRRAIAVIGTREPSSWGRRSARRIGKTLAEQGWVVVSGLALGCDAEAHEGCLEGGGQTVAVLAHGFGRIYPEANTDLADRILASGGCWVSEYPPGQPPSKGSFVERDRLQSGLAQGVIVIETGVEGGTMHTVRHATEQGRTVAAIAHPPEMRGLPKARGNQLLIGEQRALPLESREDLLNLTASIDSTTRRPPPTEQGNLADQLDLGF